MGTLPGEDGGEAPGQETDDHGARLGADVARLERLADRVVTLEADRQYRQHAGVRHRQLYERNGFTYESQKKLLIVFYVFS